MNGIKIGSTTYDVRVLAGSLKRQFTVISGSNAGQTMTYKEIPDIIGTRIDYTVTVLPNPTNRLAYDNFYNFITNPDNAPFNVTMPGLANRQDITYSARVLNGTDTLVRDYDVNGRIRVWEGLTVTFRALQPERMAT